MATANIVIAPCTSADIQNKRAELIALLQEAVDSGASVSFMAPLDLTLAASFWDRVAAEVGNQQRIVVVARDPNDGRVLGSAQAAFASVPNGSYRAEVQKVLVFQAERRKGIAKALLFALEPLTLQFGRTLLVLDTASGSGATGLYEQCGYQLSGVIPNYAYAPYGSYVDTVIYYKHLVPRNATNKNESSV